MTGKKRVELFKIIGVVFSIVSILLACSLVDEKEEQVMMTDNVISIKVNTVFQNKDLKISIGNIRISEYQQQNGEKTDGINAGMSILHKVDSSKDQFLTVYKGFNIIVDGYDISVLDITSKEVILTIKNLSE